MRVQGGRVVKHITKASNLLVVGAKPLEKNSNG
jgi:hypothetical protein